MVFSVPVWAALHWAFGLLKTTRQNIAFWLTVPLTLSAAALLWVGSGPVSPTPHLLGGIDAVEVFQSNQCITPLPYPNSDPDDVYMLIAANVRNSGSPSIADNWSLAINSLTKGSIIPEGLQLPDAAALEFIDPKTKQQFSYSGHDALYEKTFQNPVPQGSVVRGILLYRVKGYTTDDLDHPGTSYELSFTDILNRTQTIDWKWPETNRPIGHLAGLLSPNIPLPPSSAAVPTSAPSSPLDLMH